MYVMGPEIGWYRGVDKGAERYRIPVNAVERHQPPASGTPDKKIKVINRMKATF